MSYSCKIIIRDDYVKKNGKCALALQIIIDRKKFRIPIKLDVKPNQFNKIKGIVKAGNGMSKETAHDFNMIAKRELAKANELGIRARLLDKKITKKEFLFKFNTFSKRNNFIQFVEHEIELQKSIISEGTIETYIQMLKKLKLYAPDVIFTELNLEFIEGFERYLLKEGLGVNTRWKHHAKLCSFINKAIKKEIQIKNPYDQYKVKKGAGRRVYLDALEIKKLLLLYRSKQLFGSLEQTLGAFLFASTVGGIRISDMQILKHQKHLRGDRIIYTPQKIKRTGKILMVPIPTLAHEFITTQNGNLFEMKSSQIVNKDLKEIAKLANIKKHLTFHVARHTFATQYLILGGDIVTLKEILGHSKLESTMIYTHIVDSMEMNSNMQRINKLLHQKTKL